MISRFLFVTLLLCGSVRADTLEFKSVHTSEELAKYMYSLETNGTALAALLSGLTSTNTIQPSPYSAPIPVREICGTVIVERFAGALGSKFYESNKKYGVREICAFQGKDGMIHRYHIGIFEDRQYRIMMDFLERKLRIPPNHSPASTMVIPHAH